MRESDLARMGVWHYLSSPTKLVFSDVSDPAKVTYSALLFWSGTDGVAFMSMGTLAEARGISKRVATRHVTELENTGWVSRGTTTRNGREVPAIYVYKDSWGDATVRGGDVFVRGGHDVFVTPPPCANECPDGSRPTQNAKAPVRKENLPEREPERQYFVQTAADCRPDPFDPPSVDEIQLDPWDAEEDLAPHPRAGRSPTPPVVQPRGSNAATGLLLCCPACGTKNARPWEGDPSKCSDCHGKIVKKVKLPESVMRAVSVLGPATCRRCGQPSLAAHEGNGGACASCASEPENPPKTARPKKPGAAPTPEERAWFDRWWSGVPRKVSKAAALKAFAQAARGKGGGVGLQLPDEATLERATRAWAVAMEGREVAYVPHPATWLNAGGWEDQHCVEAPREPTREEREARELAKAEELFKRRGAQRGESFEQIEAEWAYRRVEVLERIARERRP